MREQRALPFSETEWLMMAPGEQPDLSTDHIEVVLQAIERLPAEDREIIEAYFYERASYREIGERNDSNKVNAWRKVQRILAKLGEELKNDETLTRRYKL